MTHIRGDVTKIYEVEKDAFTQPSEAGTPQPLYFAYALTGIGTWTVDLFTDIPVGHTYMLHSFNISFPSTGIQRIYFIKSDGTVLGDFNMYITRNKQFSLGDVSIADDEYITMYMVERVGADTWYGTIWYIDVPPAT